MQLAMDMAGYRNTASWRFAFTTSIKLPIILCLISYFLLHDVAAARCVVEASSITTVFCSGAAHVVNANF
jgi:hypothetical protein